MLASSKHPNRALQKLDPSFDPDADLVLHHEARQLIAVDQDQALRDALRTNRGGRSELARRYALRSPALDQRSSELSDLVYARRIPRSIPLT